MVLGPFGFLVLQIPRNFRLRAIFPGGTQSRAVRCRSLASPILCQRRVHGVSGFRAYRAYRVYRVNRVSGMRPESSGPASYT